MSRPIDLKLYLSAKEKLENSNLSCTAIGKIFNKPRGTIERIKKYFGIKRENIKIKHKHNCKLCNKIFIAKGICVTSPNRGKFCSKECYRLWQLSLDNRGENHPNWKVNAQHEDEIDRLRHTEEWRVWRTAVFERDNYTCKFCGLKGRKLAPHHIYPRRDHPERIFDISNGITLCSKCHGLTIKKEYTYISKCEGTLMHDNAYSFRR